MDTYRRRRVVNGLVMALCMAATGFGLLWLVLVLWTLLWNGIAAISPALFAQMTQSHIDYMLGKIPLGRFGETHEIAALVAWLASEECSFSTGAVFDLSGGRSTY